MTDLQKEQLSDWYKTGKINGIKVFEMSAAANQLGITSNDLFAYRSQMDKKEINELFIAIQSLFDALTTVWEDNGNVMADAVRDSVVTNLCQLTGYKYEEIVAIVENIVADSQ